MERVETLLQKLQDQFAKGEPPAKLLLTVQMLQHELAHLQASHPANGKEFIAVSMPVNASVAAAPEPEVIVEKAPEPPAEEEEGGDEEEGDEPPAKTEKAKKAAKGHDDAPPVFVKLEAFTVKLQSEGQEAYLQAVPELRVLDAHLGDKIKQYTPEIRHKVLLILSGKTASELSTPQGVQKLSNEMRVTINAIIEPPPMRKKGKDKAHEEPGDLAGPDDPVQAVLFTSFIVQ